VAPRVLFIVNDPIAPPAMLGDVFADLGYDTATFAVVPADGVDSPARTVEFPDPLAYEVVVPLGARWAAYDDTLPWIASEMAMVRDADAAGVGVLGVCFGGQLAARAHGGAVVRSSDPEIGWCPVRSDAPDVVPAGQWFQWHFDRFSAPPGSTILAQNDFATQAFTIGHTLGLQFHPELDGPLLQAWLDNDGAEAIALGIDPDDLLEQTARLRSDADRRLHALVRGFLAQVGRQPCPS
jgi:GMP synthase-like glutamine amidotransferase